MLINSLLKNKPTIYSQTCKEDIIHLGAITFKVPDWVPYKVYVVSKSHVARPDLISQIMYGTDIYGDFLCKVNGIPNPFEINEGDILYIPSVDAVSEFMVGDNYDDEINDDAYARNPKVKNKKEKRKANEAVVGDARFKIDKDNRVIIY